uniref:Conserved protein n=1 Tax=Rhabditophanes sp. KR3021 TaxID=114890 RepID=A0AC35TUQ0_9BILA
MFAKLDEFDSLTPLILSPASGVGSVVTFESSQASAPLARLSPTLMIDETSQTATSTSLLYKIKSPRSFNKLFGIASPVSRKSSSSNSNSKKEEFIEPEKVLQAMQAQFASQSSDSPPPPRRTSCGQTLIAPLTNFNKPVMARSQASNALTPDSRVTTFEYTTSKSCATIPEDDETEESLFCDDLISIDRTIISTLQAQNNTRYHGNYSNLSLYGTIPKHVENPTPPPSYVPAPPGTKTNDNSEASGNVYLNYKSRLNLAKLKSDSPTKKSGISNLSSPQSSIGSNSPVDTCSSESESSFIATKNEISLQHDGEEDQNEGGTGEDKYLLHRIDEVSERGESLMSASKTMDSIATISSYGGPCTNLINHYLEDQGMARSVSAQFELMNLQRKQS